MRPEDCTMEPAPLQAGEIIPKPPLGIMPREIWIEHRVLALVAAIHRCAECLEVGGFDRKALHSRINQYAREVIAVQEWEAP